MLRKGSPHISCVFARYASQEGKKRFMQTVPLAVKRSPVANFGSNFGPGDLTSKWTEPQASKAPKWASHALKTPQAIKETQPQREEISISLPTPPQAKKPIVGSSEKLTNKSTEQPITETTATATSQPTVAKTEEVKSKPRRKLRPRKALITLSDSAVEHLRALLDQPEPQLIRIGVKNRGCSGLTYHLEYVTEPGKFDETVEQNGVKVLIDSKALFSIVGSEMDWLDDKLSLRFVFKNPNSKGTCGCGESFMV